MNSVQEQAREQKAWELLRAGWSPKATAEYLNVSERQVRRYADAHVQMASERLADTPQSPTDILHKLQDNPQFLTVKFPAISDYDLKTTAWPEMFDFARLQKIKNQVGDNAFEVEYQLYPRELANSFLAADRLRACVGENLARCKTRSNRAPLRTGTIPRAGPSMGRWMSARPCTHRTLCSSSRTQRDG